MSDAKNILLVCGTSVATSTVVKEKLKEELPARGIELGTLTKAKATEAKSKVASGNYDLLVSTTSIDQDKFDIPVITTQAFMTGMGQDEVLDEIVETLQSS
jgi:PTS system galactitol-specific IIB component